MDQSVAPLTESRLPREKWWLRWWMVLAWRAIFGPFAIFTVWKSRDFNRFWKWVVTLLTIGATVILAWAAWEIVDMFLKELHSAGLY